MKRIAVAALFFTIGSLGLAGCEEGAGTFSQDLTEVYDPSGKRPFGNTAIPMIKRAVSAANEQIYLNVPLGISKGVAAAKTQLGARGIDVTALDTLGYDMLAPVARKYPGGTWRPKGGAATTSGVSSQQQALLDDNELSQYFDCPILAPEDNSDTDCAKMVQAVVVQVRNEMENEDLASTVTQAYPDLDPLAAEYVLRWAEEARTYGLKMFEIYAAKELMAAAQCDSKAEATRVSEELGKQQGWSIVETHRSWGMSQVENCDMVNTGIVAETVRQMSKNEIGSFMDQNPVCEDADLSTVNQKLAAAEQARRRGIDTGIDERVEILRAELVSHHDSWVDDNCGSDDDDDSGGGGDNGGGGGDDNGGGGGDNGGGGGDSGDSGGDGGDGGSDANDEPLAIDLDGDGLTLLEKRVEIDWYDTGVKHAMTWFGPREGVLAVDRDGDGEIDGLRELIGSGTECADGAACYDGIAAMQSFDREDRGGNGDGMLDAADRMFHRLLVWVDENSDGVSQPGELSSLADRKIRGFNLERQPFFRAVPGGTLAGSIEVLTDDGFLSVYDAWLKVRMELEDITHHMPKKR